MFYFCRKSFEYTLNRKLKVSVSEIAKIKQLMFQNLRKSANKIKVSLDKDFSKSLNYSSDQNFM